MVSWVFRRGERVSCLAKEFIDIAMVLGHPFDEMVKLLDEITDLTTRRQFHSSKRATSGSRHHSRGKNSETKERPSGTVA
jgi:hypothetical protein